MRFIILPQAIRVVVPALASEYINVVKYSSILSIVSIQELTFMGRQVILLNSDMLGTWSAVAIIYLLLTSILSFGANRLEVRMARSG
jgi:polar amino acid transport system permease protein